MWKLKDTTQDKVRKFVVLEQDLDVPVIRPVLHGSFYPIRPASTHSRRRTFRGVEEVRPMLKYGRR